MEDIEYNSVVALCDLKNGTATNCKGKSYMIGLEGGRGRSEV